MTPEADTPLAITVSRLMPDTLLHLCPEGP